MGRGRFSLRPVICWAGAPGSCPAPLRTIWHLAIGPGTARGAGLFVCSFSYWSVVSFLSASCQLYLAVSSKFVPPSPTLYNFSFFSLLLLLCFLSPSGLLVMSGCDRCGGISGGRGKWLANYPVTFLRPKRRGSRP